MNWLLAQAAVLSLAGAVVLGHGNNPSAGLEGDTLSVAGVVFAMPSELAGYMEATGLVSVPQEVDASCGAYGIWSDCANRHGVWQDEISWCIDMYLCAYAACSECDDPLMFVCIDGAQYELYACSGIDLMALMSKWGTSHDDTVAILQELY